MVSQTHFRNGCDQGEDATAPLFVLAGKRRKIKCLFSPNVKINVLFKKNSCRSIDKNAHRLSEVHLSPVLSQLATLIKSGEWSEKEDSQKMSHNVPSHLCPKVKEIAKTPAKVALGYSTSGLFMSTFTAMPTLPSELFRFTRRTFRSSSFG